MSGSEPHEQKLASDEGQRVGTNDPAETARPAGRSSPLARVVRSAQSVMDGLAVTLSYLFRPPTTIQYPDRLDRPITETLPERYRGFLEVDLATCTACKACERDCPIGCIAIDLEKVGEVRAMTRFDIDMGKCMYCNICVESCPIPNQAPGDAEVTKCIRMTREFEASTDDFSTLTFRFIRPGDAVIPFKPKKGVIEPTPERGGIAREVRRRAREYNALAARWSEARLRDDSDEAVNDPAVVIAREAELAPKVKAAGEDPRHLEDLLFAEALAQTDCGACGYDTCRGYARAIVEGSETDFGKCEPGGARTARDLVIIGRLRGPRGS
jgi:NAD(P)H-quinone oxidoreductase subunit I